MKWANREQQRAARSALDELSAYRPPNGDEDDWFCYLNTVAARTQGPLHPLQVFVLYQRWDSWAFLAVLAAGVVLLLVRAVTG